MRKMGGERKGEEQTWAWSVMPTVATDPSCFTHSWEVAYLRPSRTAQNNTKWHPLSNSNPDCPDMNPNTQTQYQLHKTWPVEKHLEREKGAILVAGGRRDEESLRALAVEDAHILSAMSCTFLHLLLLVLLLLLPQMVQQCYGGVEWWRFFICEGQPHPLFCPFICYLLPISCGVRMLILGLPIRWAPVIHGLRLNCSWREACRPGMSPIPDWSCATTSILYILTAFWRVIVNRYNI